MRWLLLVCIYAQTGTASAIDPSRRISQYAHTAFRTQDGLFRGSPYTFVQTEDGYLWLGTDAGVVRFDGVGFTTWNVAGREPLPNVEVSALLAARDGSLWIATLGGVSRWKDGQLRNYSVGSGGAGALHEDWNGTIWIARRFPDPEGRVLCRWAEPQPDCLGPADGLPPLASVGVLLEGDAGTMWLGGDTALVRWSGDAHTAYRPEALKNNGNISGITALARALDGTLWVGFSKPGPTVGLQRLREGHLEPFVSSALDGRTLAVSALHVDREGALWIGTLDRGLYRLYEGGVERFDRRMGLSGDLVLKVAEDREGNIWIVTPQGVDRLSDTAVVGFSANEGLCSGEAASVLATRDGSIWTGGDGALTRVQGSQVSCLRSRRELPGDQVTSLFEDSRGRLWVGLDDGLWVYADERFRQVQRPGGRAIGLVTSITETPAGHIWIAVSGSQRLVMRVEDLTVRQEYDAARLPRRVAAALDGGLWFGLLGGDLARYRDGTVDTYRFANDDASLLHQVLPQSDGSVLGATSFGLIRWERGRHSTLSVKNGLPCSAVNAMVFDDEDDLWLYLSCGLAEIRGADYRRWTNDPETSLSPQTLDELDGVRTGRAAFGAAARAPDGRLWFANGVQLQMANPGRHRRNTVPPPVHIDRVVADRVTYSVAAPVRLPPLTRDIEIGYTGLSFVAPQKVRFRYRLEGRDADWQDPAGRRQAFYSDLRPGTYRFHVIASNNDGVWNAQGATLELIVAAAWYQTAWFFAGCLVLAGGTGWAAYRLRLRQVGKALNARFDERLRERTRVARDLHDTLLQTLQGSKLLADQALRRPDDHAGLRLAFEQVSTWLGQAIRESRAAVKALRAPVNRPEDLAGAVNRALDACAHLGALETAVTLIGRVRELHPIVQDEVSRIAAEAIRNAYVHAGATRLAIRITYSHQLTLSVADDGAGIDAATAEHGRSGHFGLPGMRERAARIAASLTITSPGHGTEVVLEVPGRVVYARSKCRP